MENKVRTVYDEFDDRRKKHEAEQADLDDLKFLEKKIKDKK